MLPNVGSRKNLAIHIVDNSSDSLFLFYIIFLGYMISLGKNLLYLGIELPALITRYKLTIILLHSFNHHYHHRYHYHYLHLFYHLFNDLSVKFNIYNSVLSMQ